MKRKFLEDLGLEKAVIDSIMDENGKDIENAKGDTKKLEDTIATLTSEKASLEKQVSERDSQLETLKNSTGDVEALKKQIETLQADNKAAVDAHAAEIKQMKVNSAIEAAITGAKGKNAKAIKALLNLENAELAEDGTVKGLAEQMMLLDGCVPHCCLPFVIATLLPLIVFLFCFLMLPIGSRKIKTPTAFLRYALCQQSVFLCVLISCPTDRKISRSVFFCPLRVFS